MLPCAYISVSFSHPRYKLVCFGSRLFHILMWASKSKRFAVLSTRDGLRRMESRGLVSYMTDSIVLSFLVTFTQTNIAIQNLRWNQSS